MTDPEIIEFILKGDKNKFRLLVEQHQLMVFRTCMGFVHDKDDADDLTQEVFIQAYKSLTGFKGNASFSTWIYRIAVNASLNKVRRSSKNFIMQRLEAITQRDEKKNQLQITDAEDPESIIINAENAAWVRNALDSLPENQRTAIVLSKYDDLSQKDIAEIMHITEGAVESLLQRAKKNLRNKLVSGRKKSK